MTHLFSFLPSRPAGARALAPLPGSEKRRDVIWFP